MELIKWDEIQQAISIVENWDEIKIIETKLKAFQAIALQEKMAMPVKNKVARYLIDIEAKKGEWLKGNIKKGGDRKSKSHDGTLKLEDFGISKNESSRSQKLAETPKEKRDEILNEIESENKEISKSELTKRLKKEQREKEIEQIRTEPIQTPEGLFDVIVIDPPWFYGRKYDAQSSRVASPYPELMQDELMQLDIPANKDCVLWLWTTQQFIWDAKELLNYWGFDYKAILTWNKEKLGLGSWLRMQTEFCLLGIKGNPKYILTNQRDIITEPRREHSRKPEGFFKMVNELCWGRKLDYFSRQKREGWDVYGNEIKKYELER